MGTTEGKWTKGPWRFDVSAVLGPYFTDDDGDEVCLGIAVVQTSGAEEGQANGYLLAAAPDLYEALANLIPRFENACRSVGSADEWIAEATAPHRAALARARHPGETT